MDSEGNYRSLLNIAIILNSYITAYNRIRNSTSISNKHIVPYNTSTNLNIRWDGAILPYNALGYLTFLSNCCFLSQNCIVSYIRAMWNAHIFANKNIKILVNSLNFLLIINSLGCKWTEISFFFKNIFYKNILNLFTFI